MIKIRNIYKISENDNMELMHLKQIINILKRNQGINVVFDSKIAKAEAI